MFCSVVFFLLAIALSLAFIINTEYDYTFCTYKFDLNYNHIIKYTSSYTHVHVSGVLKFNFFLIKYLFK